MRVQLENFVLESQTMKHIQVYALFHSFLFIPKNYIHNNYTFYNSYALSKYYLRYNLLEFSNEIILVEDSYKIFSCQPNSLCLWLDMV